MFDNKTILSLAEKTLNTNFGEVEFKESKNLICKKENGTLTIGGANIPQKMRALNLAYINRQKDEFDICQSPAFHKLGVMADMSRGGVMRPEKVKEFMIKIALMGGNGMMLYTEDTYTLEDYPRFGFVRGAYTDDELRDIADFGENMEIEVVPCIQTLGHMAQYLTWTDEAVNVKDTDAVMLCGAKETYTFIEAEIAKMKSLFKTDRIHIGMDEAWDMGLGRYISKNGYPDRYNVFKEHLEKVVDICKKYGLKPMMWSDMFFRLASPVNEYYDTEIEVPESISSRIPDVDLVYWDYYHTDEDFYNKMIENHLKLKRPVVFGGTSYSTRGFLPIIPMTFKTAEPGLKACLKNNIGDVWATMWGDDGCETDYFDSLYGFAMYTEMCYNPNYTMEDIGRMGMSVTSMTPEIADAIEAAYIYPYLKSIVWCDIFYNLLGIDFTKDQRYKAIMPHIEKCTDEYVKLVLEIIYSKCDIYANMIYDYKNGSDMKIYSEKILPELLDKYKRLFCLFSKRWLETNKAFGYETIQARFNSSIGRLEYAIEVTGRYAAGLSDKIEELCYTPVYDKGRKPWYSYTLSGRVADFF